MGKKRKETPMTDKERILMTIIEGLYSTQLSGPANKPYNSQEYIDRMTGMMRVHFAYWTSDRNLAPGMLVLCKTSPMNPFKIGFIARRLEYGRCLIREIGSDKLCDMSNESFIPIAGLRPSQLWEGEQYRFSQKVIDAFSEGDEFDYRFGGLGFEEDGQATVWIRARYGGMLRFRKHGAKMFSVKMPYTSQTTPQEILEALRNGGYGTHSWEPVDPEEAVEKKEIANG